MKNSLFYRFMCWYDAYWRRKNNVERFDDLLSFSFENFSGEPRKMNDGSWLKPGDRLAILHFNRECFTLSPTNQQKSGRNALRFRRLFLSSFAQLAKDLNENEKFLQVKAFHGVSWIPPHGEKVGFVIERLPNSAINFIRKFYFKILLGTFFPHLITQRSNSIQPYAYWLTRQNLLKYFSKEPLINGSEINQQ